jgi:hypothetical protein
LEGVLAAVLLPHLFPNRKHHCSPKARNPFLSEVKTEKQYPDHYPASSISTGKPEEDTNNISTENNHLFNASVF